jgi:Na+-translocating ferredoxin:NAD+ oxidoreductase RnfA subunit
MRVFALVIFSSVSLNLMLQFGLGLMGLKQGQKQERLPSLMQAGALFLSVFLLWLVFRYVLFFLGFFEYMLLLPLCAAVCMGLEWAAKRLRVPDRGAAYFYPASAYNGLALTSLFLTLWLASSFVDAFVLSLGFAAGTLLTPYLLAAIRVRSSLENIPLFLRKAPLTLIVLGLLSLIFSFLTFRL